jgi:NTP pyrophosphatase (non-canonical NTP hydrolase)
VAFLTGEIIIMSTMTVGESKPEKGSIASFRHANMVDRLCKDGFDIRATLTPEDCHLIHTTMGISGEAGELLDAVKKAVIYRKPLDLRNVIEELGDIEFYMEALRTSLDITRDQTLTANMSKLATGGKARYGDSYSDQAAQERKDKND